MPAFLTQEGKPRAQLCSKAIEKGAPSICALLDRAQAEFATLNDKLAHLRLAEASAAVLALADAVQADYERRKRAEAVLDYDDLIVKTQNLLSRADAAAWVLYKIDGGIDHILVDEAQDTNPAQWSIIEALAAEFFAGAGASEKLRTLFAVGDEKQSIYSFQGANPARFGEVGRAFRQRAEALGLVWHEVPLTLSFRSTEPILEAVDSVFGRAACRRRADLAGGRDHPAPRLQNRRSGSGRAVGRRGRGKVRSEPPPSSPGTRSRRARVRSISSASASPPRSKAGSIMASRSPRKAAWSRPAIF